jgi:arylsulfatase A-like enzyme
MGEVRYVDDNVGRFFEYLKSANVFDDALIIFTSDHGEEFWEHDGIGHGRTLYDEVLRVPLMIRLPGGTHAVHRRENVSTESVVPTILDLLDLEAADAAFSAASLSWAFQADGTDPRIPIVSTATNFFEDRISVVFGPMKNIHAPASGSDELFDLLADPDEKVSQAPDRPDVVSEAHELIASHRALSEQIRQLLGLRAAGEGVLDPAALRQLRALGYIQ